MAHHILVTHQKNYRKFPPNRLIRQLYGSSVLTNHDQAWQRQRILMQAAFAPHRIAEFHDIFVTHAEQLAARWQTQLLDTSGLRRDIYPDLIALFLDIIGEAALGVHFGATQGNTDQFLDSISLILKQSTHPLYQFTKWWQLLPLPVNRQLALAYTVIDEFLYELIRQRRAEIQSGRQHTNDLLTLLLQAAEWTEGELSPLTDQEVRDNLLAIIVNGYETVATSVAFSLDLLARHSEHAAQVQAEVDQVFDRGMFTDANLTQLPYLKAVIVESLRLCPPMAGLQRISVQSDCLSGWQIPGQQVIGIPLLLLHQDAQRYGDQPEQFFPQRYLSSPDAAPAEGRRGCPFKRFLGGRPSQIAMPLTFGDGARRCLGESFVLHEMTVVLATLLHHFDFAVQPGEAAEMELGKFGLFISMLPKRGVTLTIRPRAQAIQHLQPVLAE